VKNCEKILDDFFGRHKFFGAGIVKIVPILSPLLHETSTPTSPEVIQSNTMNFRPDFYFSRLIFFGGGPPPT